MEPMLATLINEPFDDEEWIFEVKWDGFRALAFVEPGLAALKSRTHRLFTQFPTLIEELATVKDKVVLDGEIVVLDEKGVSKFQLIQNYNKTNEGDLYYFVFDILSKDGKDLRALPLIERKKIVKKLINKWKLPSICYSEHIEKEGKEFFKLAKKLKLEGIMAKKADSPYLSKRSSYWKKIKLGHTQKVVIGGFTPPKGSREKFGALLVGTYEKDKLIYAGRVGGGFDTGQLSEIYETLTPLIQKKSPFDSKVPEKNATWVKPVLICEVSFAEWTNDNRMRHPIFKGLINYG